MGSCAYVAATCKAPSSPLQLDRSADRQSVLLVDDFERTTRLLPDLPQFLVRALESGASAIVTARAQIGDDAMRALRRLLGPLQVPVTSVALAREI